MNDNANVLKASVHAFNKLKSGHIMSAVNNIAARMLTDALSLRDGWLGFTGNLPTSYAAGVWDFNGNLEIIFAEDVNPEYSLSSVRGPKVGKGERKVLDAPWEGNEPRAVTGEVNLTTRYGAELVNMFLKSYHPKRLPCIMICTGAEYSVWLEKSREGANVLSDSFDPPHIKKIGDHIFIGTPFTPRNSITRK